MAPGEMRRSCGEKRFARETVTVSINEALAKHSRLAVLGDPGSGKTTLLRYLALLYARDMAEDTHTVKEKLELDESGWLPVLLPLRKIGAYLSTRHGEDDSMEGHADLLKYLLEYLKNERISLPPDFFDEWLISGRAVILLDGLDEVADPDLRRRVSRLVESFTRAYADCRYLVTSRIVGYTGSARLGEDYTTTTVQDFSLSDIERFLGNWHRMVAVSQKGMTETTIHHAADQTQQLMSAIRENERILELAINPLMLTVIALVHRDRVKLPDRRAELYAEAIDVLLGKWDEARGVKEVRVLDNTTFDAGDKRLMLQSIALTMHENERKEIETEKLKAFLNALFMDILGDPRESERAVSRFLNVIQERAGILTARGEGVYSFSHLTFQEYLAALARDDYVAHTLKYVPLKWWREVILLEAGFLSTQSKERTSRLIRAITEKTDEPELYHNLVLAAECIRDVGTNRVEGDLEADIRRKLRVELEGKAEEGWLSSVRRRFSKNKQQEYIERRKKAAEALGRIGGDSYGHPPYGEPDWVDIPAGEFWRGEKEDVHQVHLEAYRISRTLITNAQYRLFVKAVEHEAPRHWADGRIPKGLESHPVVTVSWYDALAYCKWLGEVTGKQIRLPSEAEWEKAARGDQDQRVYPWGDNFDPGKCNCWELELRDTTPVGIFNEGMSPYGCLDMSGNVWEWTRSLWEKEFDSDFKYPYKPDDGRENEKAKRDIRRVCRGGS